MPKKYNDEFKQIVVRMYNQIQRGETLYLDNNPISSIPQLLTALDKLSTSTLYIWKEKFKIEDIVKRVLIERDQENNIVGLHIEPEYEPKPKQEKQNIIEVIPKNKIVIKGVSRFWASLASGMLEDYNYNMTLEMIYLKMGIKLIEMSGFVDMGKAKKILDGGKGHGK